MTILVTGGAGYIGSHTVLALLEENFNVAVLDNLCNSSFESIKRVESLTGKRVSFFRGDIRDKSILASIFTAFDIDCVIHFAALKAVGESATIPLSYYQNNVYGTLCLLEVMEQQGITDFIFSSSATVYGEQASVPYDEKMAMGSPSSPYGSTKSAVEQVMRELTEANSEFRGVSLRYFNPIGAHESGLLGEAPSGIPNNLLPYVAQVAVGKREQVSVFGNDYPTEDGTCKRDYLHVMDLAEGHVAALKWLKAKNEINGVEVFNLGTGRATSVLQVIRSFEKASGQKIPYEIAPRRKGDLDAFWADASKAQAQLGWKAKRSLENMMTDTWRWQSKNPSGYD